MARLIPLAAAGLLLAGCASLPLPARGGDAVSGGPAIDWRNLSNPVYEYPGWSVKDACLIEKDGVFHIYFSAFFWNEGRIRSHISGVTTEDFKTFSDPLFIWSGMEDGWTGMCSPNIALIDGVYYLTYNSWGDTHPNGRRNQLFHAKSTDLVEWEKHIQVAADATVHPDGSERRAIDITFEKPGDFWILSWKADQTPQVAWAEALEGPWTLLGRPTEQWFENAQFIRIDDEWRMLVTARENPERQHLPYLLRLAEGDGSEPEHFARWDDWHPIEVPLEGFNTDDRGNAAFLMDRRAIDGYFYLVYAGNTQKRTHAGRGDNRLGLMRSRDLDTWVVPGDTSH